MYIVAYYHGCKTCTTFENREIVTACRRAICCVPIDGSKLATISERHLSNISYIIRYHYFYQSATIAERIAANRRYAVRYCYFCQSAAPWKRTVANRRYAFGYCNTCQACATTKIITRYRLHIVSYYHGCNICTPFENGAVCRRAICCIPVDGSKSATIAECVETNLSYVITYCYTFQFTTVFEQITRNCLYIIAYYHGCKTCTFSENGAAC